MKRMKRLGRGLEDFSYLFLSSKSTREELRPDGTKDVAYHTKVATIPARTICITSDKKVGERAFLTVNLALEIANQGKRVLVVDADFSLPRLCMLMGVPSQNSILHFIANNGEENIIADGINGVKLITLDADLSDLRSLSESERTSLMRYFVSAEEEADIILVTTSSAFLHHMRAMLRASSEVIVIAPQQLADMINAYAVIKTVFQVNHCAKVGIISSRILIPDQAEAVFEKVQRIVKKFLDKQICYYGYIPEDNEISLSMERRKPLTLTSPDSHTVKCVTEISQSILKVGSNGMGEHSDGGSRVSFAKRLLHKSAVTGFD